MSKLRRMHAAKQFHKHRFRIHSNLCDDAKERDDTRKTTLIAYIYLRINIYFFNIYLIFLIFLLKKNYVRK